MKLPERYWWFYGELGQKLVEKSGFVKNMLEEGDKIIDGHEEKTGFKNFDLFFHLDTVIVNSGVVKKIIETKTTKNQSKNRFPANGLGGHFMIEAEKKGIDLFFAVVRLNKMPSTNIIHKRGFDKELELFLNNQDTYDIEFYDSEKFEIVGGEFVVKSK
jgi:hypothetical protein